MYTVEIPIGMKVYDKHFTQNKPLLFAMTVSNIQLNDTS